MVLHPLMRQKVMSHKLPCARTPARTHPLVGEMRCRREEEREREEGGREKKKLYIQTPDQPPLAAVTGSNNGVVSSGSK